MRSQSAHQICKGGGRLGPVVSDARGGEIRVLEQVLGLGGKGQEEEKVCQILGVMKEKNMAQFEQAEGLGQ